MRRLFVIVLCAILATYGIAGAVGGSAADIGWTIVPPEELPDERNEWWPDAGELRGARELAFDWLDDQQGVDGLWSEDYGITALVAFAMLNGGREAEHPVVATALAVLLAEAREDGSFSEGTYIHYYTSVAVMALSAGGADEHETLVRDGVDMLVRDQCDGDEEGFEEWWRGGIGYGNDGRPDMSNTQFALMALASAEAAYPSIEIPLTTWQGALTFLHRCQNLPLVNDFDWAKEVGNPSYDDGGFIYFPGRSNAGDLDSYGSMTAAGLWCLLVAGEGTDSLSSEAAIGWLLDNFDADANPGFDEVAYYYYTWALARAFRTAGAPAFSTGDGTMLFWAMDLADALLDRQTRVGSWHNTASDAYWEGRPEVATCFALLALEAMMPSAGGLRIDPGEGGKVRVTDPQGRRDSEIPGWSREVDGSVVIEDASLGPFSVDVKGSDTVEVGASIDGETKVWREVGLSREGGRMTVDVAPLLGPASVVIASVGDLPEATAASSTPGAGVMMALAAVVALAALAALSVRGRTERKA